MWGVDTINDEDRRQLILDAEDRIHELANERILIEDAIKSFKNSLTEFEKKIDRGDKPDSKIFQTIQKDLTNIKSSLAELEIKFSQFQTPTAGSDEDFLKIKTYIDELIPKIETISQTEQQITRQIINEAHLNISKSTDTIISDLKSSSSAETTEQTNQIKGDLASIILSIDALKSTISNAPQPSGISSADLDEIKILLNTLKTTLEPILEKNKDTIVDNLFQVQENISNKNERLLTDLKTTLETDKNDHTRTIQNDLEAIKTLITTIDTRISNIPTQIGIPEEDLTKIKTHINDLKTTVEAVSQNNLLKIVESLNNAEKNFSNKANEIIKDLIVVSDNIKPGVSHPIFTLTSEEINEIRQRIFAFEGGLKEIQDLKNSQNEIIYQIKNEIPIIRSDVVSQVEVKVRDPIQTDLKHVTASLSLINTDISDLRNGLGNLAIKIPDSNPIPNYFEELKTQNHDIQKRVEEVNEQVKANTSAFQNDLKQLTAPLSLLNTDISDLRNDLGNLAIKIPDSNLIPNYFEELKTQNHDMQKRVEHLNEQIEAHTSAFMQYQDMTNTYLADMNTLVGEHVQSFNNMSILFIVGLIGVVALLLMTIFVVIR